MVLSSYLKQAADLFDENKRRSNKEKRYLRTLLTELKSREDTLDVRLNGHQPDKVRKAIERELKVIGAQRRKGLTMLGELESDKRFDVDASLSPAG